MTGSATYRPVASLEEEMGTETVRETGMEMEMVKVRGMGTELGLEQHIQQ